MREFDFSLTDHLKAGLRRDHEVPKNTPGLEVCHNFRVQESGLSPLAPILRELGVEVDFPFPQVFDTSKELLVLTSDTIYSVDRSTLALTEHVVYDYESTSTDVDFAVAGPWHLVDNGKSWTLVGQTGMLLKPYYERLTEVADRVRFQGDVWAQTGCVHRGRTLLGGFTPTRFWNADWQTFWENMADTWPTLAGGQIAASGIDLDNNFVMWSNIGGNLMWLLYNDIALQGYMSDTTYGSGYTATTTLADSLLYDMLKENSMGWMPMPWAGYVRWMAPLGDQLAVYGDGGVSFLRTVSSPVATYGLVETGQRLPGIAHRNAACSGSGRHIYIDHDGYLWQVTADLKGEKLGYQEFFAPLTEEADSVSICYNTIEDEFYITTPDMTYVLTKWGLSTSSQLTTGLAHLPSGTVGSYVYTGSLSKMVVTSPLDFGRRSMKSVQRMTVEADTYTGMSTSTYLSYDGSKYNRSPWKPVGREGNSYPMTTATDFKVAVKSTTDEDVTLGSLEVSLKDSDKRFRRGIDASKTN